MRLLVTGACGFIGTNFVRHMLRTHPGYHITNLDALTYAGNRENLADLEADARYAFVRGRVEDPATVRPLVKEVDAVVHFAAESHVDRSIDDAAPFVRTNVIGTAVVLDAAHEAGVERLVHVSTDEVYGSLGDEGVFTEETPLAPRSPYAASKAAGDLMALAHFETHALPVSVVRPSNNYGPYQLPEKLIPLAVTNLVEGAKIPVYGDGRNVRDWLYVEDNCRAIDLVLHRGKPGRAYNIGGESERRNREVVHALLELMGKTDEWLESVPDRPGHDYRYAVSNARIRDELGWQPTTPFAEGLKATIDWYRANESWWRPIKSRLQRGRSGFWTGQSKG